MDVLRAKTAGFCMGVSLALKKLDSAIEVARSAGNSYRICTFGPIIHNPQVLASYTAKGIVCVNRLEELCPGDHVLIRAHGIPRQDEKMLRQSGVHVVDATCPKVKKAQLAIAKATEFGAVLVLFGEAEHPEVRGLVSYACGEAHIVTEPAALEKAGIRHDRQLVLASQTTQDREGFARLETTLEKKYPELTVLSTICDATSLRQDEARQLATCVDVMVIVGGKQSGNTRRLADVAASSGIITFHVESVEELSAKDFSQKKCIGLTAGASTPKSLIDQTEDWLRSL